MKIIEENHQDSLKIALDFLKNKKAIIFATDTVYGLAVDASSFEAVENLYKIKKRDLKKPIAIFVKNLEKAKEIFDFDKKSLKIANKFLPGPLTMVLRVKNKEKFQLSSNLTNSEFLGFRIVDKKFINNLFNHFDGALAVTSANISNQKDSNLIQEVVEYFSDLDILVVKSDEKDRIEKPSTVVKIDNEKIEILREGSISKELLENL